VSGDELTPETRALLGAARGADDPADGDRDRVRARVLAAIGAGAAGTAGAGSAKAAPAAGGAAIAKLALLLLAVGGVATGAYLALRGGGGGDAGARQPAPVIAHEPAPAPEVLPELPPEPEPELEIVMDAEPARDREPEGKPPRVKRPKPEAPEAAEPPAPSPADSLQAERALLAKANAALRDGNPDAALAALGEHQKKFPRGVLEEERAATTVLALCATGRASEGKKSRDRFLTAWPRSVHAARVRAACAD